MRGCALADLQRFYAQAKAEGFVAAALSGGEPFLRSDLGAVVRFMKQEAGKEVVQLDRFRQLRRDAEGCSSCNSPTMVDLSHLRENPALAFEPGGIAVG